MNAGELRKKIQERQREATALLHRIKQRPPLMRGIVYLLRRKCGKAGCRCQKGDLHESWVLSVPDRGRKQIRTVPRGKRMEWMAMTERYRCFRRSRARLVRVFSEIIELVDELERERTVPPSKQERK